MWWALLREPRWRAAAAGQWIFAVRSQSPADGTRRRCGKWSGCSCRKQGNGFKNSSSSQLVPILLFSLRAIPDIYSTIVLACHILCSLRVHRFNLHSLSNRKSRGFFLTPFIDSTFFVSIIFKFHAEIHNIFRNNTQQAIQHLRFHFRSEWKNGEKGDKLRETAKKNGWQHQWHAAYYYENSSKRVAYLPK